MLTARGIVTRKDSTPRFYIAYIVISKDKAASQTLSSAGGPTMLIFLQNQYIPILNPKNVL